MTPDATTREEFLGAFRAMSKVDRHALLQSLSRDSEFQEDLARVLVTTLKALRDLEDEAVFRSILRELAKESGLLEDILDSALVLERGDGPSRPFKEYLAERGQ